MVLDPSLRRQRARIGGYALAAQHDPRVYTAKARETFLARFEREVDPDGTLPPAERQRRAIAARRAYYAKLALKSAKARKTRSKARRAAA